MKKLLALVLALVMVLSLCTVTNAAYPDAADIDYEEAVDVMSAVGVFQGDEKGNFNPDANLTREQAAKLIAYLDLGEKVAEALPEVKVFSDVEANRWSSKYVAYCADAGYIAGLGDGTFNPTGELTGYAFGKLLLCVLGYDATIEGFTGASWSINVAKFMEDNDINDGVDKSGSAALTREEAAQFCLNALKADCVKYAEGGTTITTGDVTITTGASKAEDVKNEKFDYMDREDNEVQQLIEKLYPDMKLDSTSEDAIDDFGRPATVWYDEDGEEIGTYADEADYVLVAEKDTNLAELLEDNDLEKKVNVPDEEEPSDEWIEAGVVVELWVEDKEITAATAYAYYIFKIDEVEEVESDEDDFEKYGISKYYTVVDLEGNAADTEDEFIDASNDDYEGDAVAIGDFEEGDVVMVPYCFTTEEIGEVVKATSFDAAVTKTNTNKVTADGTAYAATSAVVGAVNFDDTFTFYTDPNGIVVDVEVAEEAEEDLEYVYVLDAEAQGSEDSLISAKDNAAKVEVIYVDGTKEVVDYALTKATKDIKDTDIEDGDYYFTFDGDKVKFTVSAFEEKVVEGWYAFTEKDGAITLKSAEKDDVSAIETVTAEKDETELADGLRATSSTKLVVLDEDGLFETYTGYKNFPKADANDKIVDMTALVVYGASTSSAKTVYVYTETVSEAAEKIDVAMFVSNGSTTADGVEVTFYVDGEKQVYVLEDALSDAAAGELFEITIDGEDVSADPLDAEDFATGVIEAVDDAYIALVDDAEEIDLADDCAVYSVAKDGKTLSKGSLAEEQNVVIFADDDGAYLIFIYKDALYGELYN